MKITLTIDDNLRFFDDSKDKVIGVIRETKEYNKFHFSKLNRELNPSHAKDLYKKIKAGEDIVIEPIIVDKKFNIVDGQHRFWALSKAKKSIPYIVDKNISVNATTEINGNQRQMKFDDYIKIWAERKNADYQMLLNEIEKYKSVTSSGFIASTLFNKEGSRVLSGNIVKAVRNGQFKFDYSMQPKVESYFEFLNRKKKELHLRSRIPQGAQKAIISFYLNPMVDEKRLFRILDDELIKRIKGDEYSKRLIADAYNQRLKSNAINYFFGSKCGKTVFEFLN